MPSATSLQLQSASDPFQSSQLEIHGFVISYVFKIIERRHMRIIQIELPQLLQRFASDHSHDSGIIVKQSWSIKHSGQNIGPLEFLA